MYIFLNNMSNDDYYDYQRVTVKRKTRRFFLLSCRSARLFNSVRQREYHMIIDLLIILR